MYHLTENGPKRCRATQGRCPFGAFEHYEALADASKVYELQHVDVAYKPTKKSGLRKYLRHTTVDVTRIAKDNSKIVLSDVDGTLVRGSLANDHAAWLHEKGVIDLGDLPARWHADPKNEERLTELAVAYGKAISGKTLKELRVREFMDETMSDESKFYSSLNQLKEARAAGHDVILISGSPQYLVGDFAKRFGFTAVGSNYHQDRHHRFNGRITGMFGAKSKQSVIEKLELERYETVVAYGDTESDRPLLEVAHHSVLIDPTAETLSRYDHIDEILRL
jgi:HAD superfamily phosphoserine phosphatase-like hydrolase